MAAMKKRLEPSPQYLGHHTGVESADVDHLLAEIPPSEDEEDV